MPAIRGRVLPVLVAAAVLLGGANLAAYAANGQPLLLGKKNGATKTTTLKNGKGTPLSLKAKKNKPPLRVSNSTTVKKLSADLLDGEDGGAYKNKTYVYALSASSTAAETAWTLPGLPPGGYLAGFNVAAVFSAAPTALTCFFIDATGSTATVSHISGGTTTDNPGYVSGGGYLDTTGGAKVLACEKGGGGTMTVGGLFSFPSQVSFTRVDEVIPGASTGAPLVLTSRPGGRVLQP